MQATQPALSALLRGERSTAAQAAVEVRAAIRRRRRAFLAADDSEPETTREPAGAAGRRPRPGSARRTVARHAAHAQPLREPRHSPRAEPVARAQVAVGAIRPTRADSRPRPVAAGRPGARSFTRWNAVPGAFDDRNCDLEQAANAGTAESRPAVEATSPAAESSSVPRPALRSSRTRFGRAAAVFSI